MTLFKIKLWNFEENVKLTYLGFFCVSHMYYMLKCILPCSTTQKIFFLRTKRLDILYHVKFVASKVKLINCQKKKMWLILYELKNLKKNGSSNDFCVSPSQTNFKKIPKQVWPYNREHYGLSKDIGRIIPLPIVPISMISWKMFQFSLVSWNHGQKYEIADLSILLLKIHKKSTQRIIFDLKVINH